MPRNRSSIYFLSTLLDIEATKVLLHVCRTTYNAEVSHTKSIKKHNSVERKKEPAPPLCVCVLTCGPQCQYSPAGGAVLRNITSQKQGLSLGLLFSGVSTYCAAVRFRRVGQRRGSGITDVLHSPGVSYYRLQILFFFHIEDLMGRAGNLRQGDREKDCWSTVGSISLL